MTLHQVNANAATPMTVDLRGSGIGLVHVDGGPGFELLAHISSGDAVGAAPCANDGTRGPVRRYVAGQTITIREQFELWTEGAASRVTFERGENCQTKHGHALRKERARRAALEPGATTRSMKAA